MPSSRTERYEKPLLNPPVGEVLNPILSVRSAPLETAAAAEKAAGEAVMPEVRFRSLEAGAKLLTPQNRALLTMIVHDQPKSVSELARLSGRAEQNVMRTLKKFNEAGIVRFDRGEGRSYRPVVAAKKVHFEIELIADHRDIGAAREKTKKGVA